MTKTTSIVFKVGEGQDALTLTIQLSESATGSVYHGATQTVGITTWDAIGTGVVTVPDLLMVKNNDATNYVEIATDGSGTNKIAKLTAGRAAFFPPVAGVTFYAKANTGNVQIKVQAAVA